MSSKCTTKFEEDNEYEDDGKCPNCGEDELDGPNGRCYYCGEAGYIS